MRLLRFICAAAIGVSMVLATSASSVQAQQKVLKMQATWPASLTLYENFTYSPSASTSSRAARSRSRPCPRARSCPPSRCWMPPTRRCSTARMPGRGYWTGKNKTAILFTGGPGGTFGMDYIDYMGWIYYGGGLELYQEFYQKELKLNVVVFPILPSGPQAFGWFKKPIQTVEDMKGMKCRQTGMAGEVWQAHGLHRRQHAGRRNHSLRPARRDRLRRVGRRRRGPAARLPQRLEVPLFAGRA